MFLLTPCVVSSYLQHYFVLFNLKKVKRALKFKNNQSYNNQPYLCENTERFFEMNECIKFFCVKLG